MRVLVACETSGVVRRVFAAKGHETHSVDRFPSDDGGELHWVGDARLMIPQGWDLIIAHPPCTAVAVSGNAHYANTPARAAGVAFVKEMADLMSEHAPRWAIENPVGVLSSQWRKPTQYIQPHQFGHPEAKKTGLWLNGLDPLVPTDVLSKPACGYWNNQTPSGQNNLGPSADRWKIRSRTYVGIAQAMSDQWLQGE